MLEEPLIVDISTDIWRYSDIVSPVFKDNLKAHAEDLFGSVVLELTDGKIRVGKRQALFNLIIWSILTRFGIPICKHHFVRRQGFNNSSFYAELNKYYSEILNTDVRRSELLKQQIWDTLQELYQFCCEELPAYSGTLDILDMAEIMTDPPMKALLDTKEEIAAGGMNTKQIETFTDTQMKSINKLFTTKGALKNEAMRPYQSLSMINKFQIPQMIYAFGLRTDVSDEIVTLPVIGSALDGIRNIQEYGVESLSARKSQFYNKNSVTMSQYWGRKQHLICSSIEHIYAGDCGSTNLVNYTVTDRNWKNLVGKIALLDGKLQVLTNDILPNLIHQDIQMRSPLTCRYRNGVCEVCGGTLIAQIPKRLNIGILSAIRVVEPTTQKILSAKHLIKTNSLIYKLPYEASKLLTMDTERNLLWIPAMRPKLEGLQFGIYISDFLRYHDIKTIARNQMREQVFSSITKFFLKSDSGYILEYPLESDNQIPYLSLDMLSHIKSVYKQRVEDDNGRVWFPLANSLDKPVFTTGTTNDSMIRFVRNVSAFLDSNIKEYTSCSKILQDFSDIIYSQVSVNIAHIEVLLKAYQITSVSDYRIPLVTDPDDVRFGNLKSILIDRHIGTELAFEAILKYFLEKPSTYLVSRQRSPFDLLTIGR